ncbi:hypothetical protein J7T55_000432 [Diaporthe amygdali]|uniref:uncharacterized protein n=1 Tax=Phomopsis amygdali TaxID=1214568 RepID=UPI0022FEC625|nr:uncharacterized protein J7T55_000432 [Diaporthe amygdali]KAJ0109506.1 hypothetical protein J7T55_000432 [Diaporthe amygdali]
MRQSKLNLRATIEQLRRQQASNELVINTVAHSRKWKEVLCHLRSGRSVEAIANWLRRGNQLSSGAGDIPSLSHLSGADTDLDSPTLISGVSDTSHTFGISDELLSASTVSTMSSDSLLSCSSRYDLDTNSQWSQYSEASQAHSNRSNSQPATNNSQDFASRMNTNDLVAFWADSVPLPVAPSPASSGVASSGGSVENSLFWPFPLPGWPILPTGDAFMDAGFGMM